ncbi:hypothetical protein ACHAW5_005660 [Stephanodiscus triporus]|uniref:Uncharacterized protein n=1 Tax=Stephanodiscus triporus TaxID=2934178 RepID=A0ABD3Q551_9STRA
MCRIHRLGRAGPALWKIKARPCSNQYEGVRLVRLNGVSFLPDVLAQRANKSGLAQRCCCQQQHLLHPPLNEPTTFEESMRNVMKRKGSGSSESPLSLIDYDNDGSWDNGSWDDDDIAVDDVSQDHAIMDSADKNRHDWNKSQTDNQPYIQPPDIMTERRCLGPQPLSIKEKGTIKMAEFRCNCLELIMPLTESDIGSPQVSNGSIDPNKLPDGIATKTLPDGTSVLVNYERLLQIEATKRIFLQRSVETYAETTAKLQSRLEDAMKQDSKASIAAQNEIARLEGILSHLKDNSQTNHRRQLKFGVPHPNQWLLQHSKSKTVCVTFKCSLMASILWLLAINISVHSLFVKKLMEQQLIQVRRRKESFVRSFASPDETVILSDLFGSNGTNLTAPGGKITKNLGFTIDHTVENRFERENMTYSSKDASKLHNQSSTSSLIISNVTKQGNSIDADK